MKNLRPRILGLDVGQQTLGVALSDSLGFTAQGITTYRFPPNHIPSIVKFVVQFCAENEIKAIVIGWPLHMHGEVSERAIFVQTVRDQLALAIAIPIHLMDERWTTKLAENRLIEANVSRQKRKEVIDKMAAVVILQNFLDRQAQKEK